MTLRSLRPTTRQPTGTLEFPAGDTSKTVTVLVNGDLLDEVDEGFLLNLTGPTNATLADGQGAGTITDDDATPTLSINDVTQLEGDTGSSNATFTVSLSAPSGQPVTVDYASENGSAIAPEDYNAASGTLTLAPGVTSASRRRRPYR